MKKLLLITAICLSSCISVLGQSIHFICFADTNDEKIGKGVSKNVNLMMNFVMTLATGIDMEEHLQPAIVMMGDDCNSENLISIIQEFECSEDDIVIFSYLGHGGRGMKDTSDFPQMCLGSNDQDDFIPLEYVKDAIVQKGPRLCLVLGDCCNNYSSGILPKENVLMVASAPTKLNITQTKGLKKLFLETSGSIMAAGCKKGEYSWVNSAEGGFFTNGLLWEIDSYTSSSRGSYDWNELLKQMRSRVVDFSRRALMFQGGYVQTPIFKVESRTVPKIPIKDVKINDSIRTALIAVADASKSQEQRINQYQSILSQYFSSSDSMIDIVGQDQHTLVGYTTAYDYLLRLATVDGLANFTILEQKKDENGKIQYLKLHEIYRN